MTTQWWVIVVVLLLLAVIVGACCWDVERLHTRQDAIEKELARLTEAEDYGTHSKKRGPA